MTFPEALTATEHFQLGRFGEVTVSSDGRLFQPTERVEPGSTRCRARWPRTAAAGCCIDDGSNVQNPATVPFLDARQPVRIGDTATGDHRRAQLRLQPLPAAADRADRLRPHEPAPGGPGDVGGDVQVASFNTLNYFTTLADRQPGRPRAPTTPTEFARQQAKEVAAILGIDADVLGLMEVENNGADGDRQPRRRAERRDRAGHLRLHHRAGDQPAERVRRHVRHRRHQGRPHLPAGGGHAGRRRADVGRPDLRPAAADPDLRARRRAARRSPSSSTTSSPRTALPRTARDADQGDGQSCFNARRVAAGDRRSSTCSTTLGAPNPLIIGDLNSYTEEDPIHVLEDAGYTGLSEVFIDRRADRYSFVFDGFSGELDHALAGADLLDNVTGATIWHINADEPLILDYNPEFGPTRASTSRTPTAPRTTTR